MYTVAFSPEIQLAAQRVTSYIIGSSLSSSASAEVLAKDLVTSLHDKMRWEEAIKCAAHFMGEKYKNYNGSERYQTLMMSFITKDTAADFYAAMATHPAFELRKPMVSRTHMIYHNEPAKLTGSRTTGFLPLGNPHLGKFKYILVPKDPSDKVLGLCMTETEGFGELTETKLVHCPTHYLNDVLETSPELAAQVMFDFIGEGYTAFGEEHIRLAFDNLLADQPVKNFENVVKVFLDRDHYLDDATVDKVLNKYDARKITQAMFEIVHKQRYDSGGGGGWVPVLSSRMIQQFAKRPEMVVQAAMIGSEEDYLTLVKAGVEVPTHISGLRFELSLNAMAVSSKFSGNVPTTSEFVAAGGTESLALDIIRESLIPCDTYRLLGNEVVGTMSPEERFAFCLQHILTERGSKMFYEPRSVDWVKEITDNPRLLFVYAAIHDGTIPLRYTEAARSGFLKVVQSFYSNLNFDRMFHHLSNRFEATDDSGGILMHDLCQLNEMAKFFKIEEKYKEIPIGRFALAVAKAGLYQNAPQRNHDHPLVFR